MSIAKTYGAREDIDVLTQCSKCMLAGYEVGYTDGAATSAHKTTLAGILADTTLPSI